MNIGLFSETYPPDINGVATSTNALFNVLNAHGHHAYVITTQLSDKEKEVTFEDNIIRIPGFEFKQLYGYRIAGIYNPQAMKIIKQLKLDVIHVQTEAGIGIFGKTIARNLQLPVVYTYHTMYEDYTYYVTRGRIEGFARQVVRNFSRGEAEKATEFITPSEKVKDIIRSYGYEGYINVVPTGVDFSRFEASRINHEKLLEFKKKHNLEDKFILLSLGRVAKEKSIDVLLRGYADYLKNEITPTHFLIVGLGPALEDLKLLAQQLKIEEHVTFLGPVPPEDTPFYYHLGDLFVSASISETQGLTFMEAMAAGKLLLARYDENLVDVIKDGKTGFFFHNEKDFETQLNKVILLEPSVRDEMIKSAYQLVETYSLPRFYTNIMEVYRRAVRHNF
ncbi:MAG: glycosyltransferase [Bacilli bacterium]|jgi:1,2-diacylglycerol 3-alpha-glucosyltransferase|nr:glycosyltransferase [Bacilli bacterium]MDD3389158.1 glycosyltransferase [Bacilli bacterium]MDD4344802.1 glycosyltransferase [Bacilli bacterium]MDD4520874.1 glycosyltransferase [Bacilli bacterium]MDY0399609.1 glycosyltransferase [Bacilli bacterium]